MKYIYTLLAMAVIFTACNKPVKEEVVISNIEFIENPAGENAGLPYLTKGGDGQLYMSWTVEDSIMASMYFSKLENEKWTAPQMIVQGDDWFVNWADYPTISTLEGQKMIAHFSPKSGSGTYSYDVAATISNNGGETWGTPFILHDDGESVEHGFVSMAPYKGNFFVTWLDGRNTAMPKGGDLDDHADHMGHGGGAMTLRGAIVSPEGQKIEEWELDNKVCDCCQTGAAITENGPVVVYRNRSDEEIRDMNIVRLVDGEWSEPMPIYNDNWNIAGCPVNGPRIVTSGNNVAVAWFTASPDPRVNVVFSKDGGETFSEPVKIDEGNAIGRVDVEFIESSAFVSWMEGGDIVGALLKDGQVTKRYLLANSSESRSSGFPQISKVDSKILVAWTDSEEKSIKTGFVKLY